MEPHQSLVGGKYQLNGIFVRKLKDDLVHFKGRPLTGSQSRSVHIGRDTETGHEVAVKLEPVDPLGTILHEVQVHKTLQGGIGIPKALWYGPYQLQNAGGHSHCNALVTDLLGPSLEDLLQSCGGKFSLKTVLLLADQLIERLRYIHSQGFVYRDIKPGHFLMDHKHHNLVYIIDMAACMPYPESLEKPSSSFQGKSRFASFNTHIGAQVAQCDDMESLGYLLMYFLRGSLPWQGLSKRAATKEAKYEKLKELKAIPEVTLCEGYPPEFADYFRHCQSLGVKQQPDYHFLKTIFFQLYQKERFAMDHVFDWSLTKKEKGPLPAPTIAEWRHTKQLPPPENRVENETSSSGDVPVIIRQPPS